MSGASPLPVATATDKVTRAEEDALKERGIRAAEIQAEAMTRRAKAAERQAEAEEQRAQDAFWKALEPSPVDPVLNMIERFDQTEAIEDQQRTLRDIDDRLRREEMSRH